MRGDGGSVVELSYCILGDASERRLCGCSGCWLRIGGMILDEIV